VNFKTLDGLSMNGLNQNLFKNIGVANQTSNSLIYLQNVWVRFDQIQALQGIDLSVNPGEMIFVTGVSGAGKTTLLNILAGDIQPDKGRVLGHAFNPSTHFISRVFQDLRLLDLYSCRDNLEIAYDPKLHSSRSKFQNELKELCQILDVTNFLSVKIKDANGGLKQKIAIIRSLLSQPTIMIADEPTCSMDKHSARKIFDLVNFYNTKRKLTVIWATHDRELINQFPGRIIHLDKGKLVYSGNACFI
jgi:ABC-type multidrug transport system ATPase subunit